MTLSKGVREQANLKKLAVVHSVSLTLRRIPDRRLKKVKGESDWYIFITVFQISRIFLSIYSSTWWEIGGNSQKIAVVCYGLLVRYTGIWEVEFLQGEIRKGLVHLKMLSNNLQIY